MKLLDLIDQLQELEAELHERMDRGDVRQVEVKMLDTEYDQYLINVMDIGYDEDENVILIRRDPNETEQDVTMRGVRT